MKNISSSISEFVLLGLFVFSCRPEALPTEQEVRKRKIEASKDFIKDETQDTIKLGLDPIKPGENKTK